MYSLWALEPMVYRTDPYTLPDNTGPSATAWSVSKRLASSMFLWVCRSASGPCAYPVWANAQPRHNDNRVLYIGCINASRLPIRHRPKYNVFDVIQPDAPVASAFGKLMTISTSAHCRVKLAYSQDCAALSGWVELEQQKPVLR